MFHSFPVTYPEVCRTPFVLKLNIATIGESLVSIYILLHHEHGPSSGFGFPFAFSFKPTPKRCGASLPEFMDFSHTLGRPFQWKI